MHVFRKVPRVAGTVKAAMLARTKSKTVYRTREKIYLQQKKGEARTSSKREAGCAGLPLDDLEFSESGRRAKKLRHQQ